MACSSFILKHSLPNLSFSFTSFSLIKTLIHTLQRFVKTPRVQSLPFMSPLSIECFCVAYPVDHCLTNINSSSSFFSNINNILPATWRDQILNLPPHCPRYRPVSSTRFSAVTTSCSTTSAKKSKCPSCFIFSLHINKKKVINIRF